MKPERAVLLLAAVLFLWFLWGHDLWAPDEPFFGEGAREMVVDGQWIVPHVNGVVNNHKPPLFFWLIALLSLPFGTVLELTARLPSALAALGTLALTMRLGRRLYGPRTAALAGVILATSFMFWDKARWCQIDALLCFLIWVALSAFEAWRAGDADGRRAGMLFWLAVALAVLAKGPVGLLLPVGVVIVTLALDHELGRLRGFAPLLGPLVFVVVTGAWVAAATLAGPDGYSVWGALREHFVERGIYGMHHKRPIWYYAERLPSSIFPWVGLLPGALVLAFRRRSAAERFLLTASLFVVIFFSISTEKRDLYVLPSFPALALLMAALVAGVIDWREASLNDGPLVSRRWVTVGQGIIGGLMFLVGLALPVLARAQSQVPFWIVLALAAIVVATGAITLRHAVIGRILPSVLATAAGMALSYLVATAVLFPQLEPAKSGRPFALRIQEVTAPSRAAGEPVLAYDLANIPVAFAFYSNGVYTKETKDASVLADHLARSGQVFAVVNQGGLDEVPRETLDRIVIIDRTRLSRRDVLLISNRPHPEGRPYTAN